MSGLVAELFSGKGQKDILQVRLLRVYVYDRLVGEHGDDLVDDGDAARNDYMVLVVFQGDFLDFRNCAQCLQLFFRCDTHVDEHVRITFDPRDEFGKRAAGDRVALVHDADAGGHRFDFLDVVGGVEDGCSFRGQLFDEFEDEVARLGVDTDGRFVHDDQFGFVHERAPDIQPPLHASAEVFGLFTQASFQADDLGDFEASCRQLLLRHAVEASEEFEVLLRGHLLVDRQFLCHIPDATFDFLVLSILVDAEHRYFPVVYRDQADYGAYTGGFSSSVRSEQSDYFAFPHVQAEGIERQVVSEPFHDIFNVDDHLQYLESQYRQGPWIGIVTIVMFGGGFALLR